jgi:hypothetical protein
VLRNSQKRESAARPMYELGREVARRDGHVLMCMGGEPPRQHCPKMGEPRGNEHRRSQWAALGKVEICPFRNVVSLTFSQSRVPSTFCLKTTSLFCMNSRIRLSRCPNGPFDYVVTFHRA